VIIQWLSGTRLSFGFASSLATSVEELGWPTAVDYASCAPEKRQTFETNFLRLISVQLLYVVPSIISVISFSHRPVVVSCTRERDASQTRRKDYTPSRPWCSPFPFDSSTIMTASVTLIDLTRSGALIVPYTLSLTIIQPEWYFTYILNIAHEHHFFMDTVVQRLLSKSEYKQISAWVRSSALISVCLLYPRTHHASRTNSASCFFHCSLVK
jgi:RAD50-interacting protein 1